MTVNSGANITGAAYGGATNGSQTVSVNTLTFNGGTAMLGVGGYSALGDVTDNMVSIHTGVTVTGGIMGGSSGIGNVLRNTVEMDGGNVAEIGAGYTREGESSYNIVTMTGGDVTAAITGGSVLAGTTTHNEITIGSSAGAIGTFIVSGYVYTAGDAANNTLDFNGGTLSTSGALAGFMAAGYTSNGTVSENKTNITGGTVYGGYGYDDYGNSSGLLIPQGVYGGLAVKGNASANELEITGGDLDGIVAAGRAEEGDATGNILNYSGATLQKTGTLDPFLGAGFSKKGNATGNTAVISDGTIMAGESGAYFSNGMILGIYGGGAIEGNANDNHLTIDDGIIEGDVAGGGTITGEASRNTVTVNDGDFNSVIVGGYTITGNSDHNKVFVNGGTFAPTDDGIGGGITGDGSASFNTAVVDASGSNIGNSLMGGHSFGGLFFGKTLDSRVDGNVIEFKNGELGASGAGNGGLVAGGINWDGDVRNNKVTISDGTIYGGDDEDSLGVYGGMTYNGDAVGNVLILEGGTLSGSFAAGHVAENPNSGFTDGTGNGNALNNTLRILSGANIPDGNISAGATINGDAIGNRLFMDGGAVATNSAVTAAVVNGDGDVRGNYVEIAGGSVTGTVLGGIIAGTGEASGNTVVVTGNAAIIYNATAAVGGMPQVIAGGVLMDAGRAVNNTVRISGNADIDADMALYGGYSFMGGAADVTTGNTLSIEKIGVTAKSAANFSRYAFVVPDTGLLSSPMLALTDTADLSGTTITIDAGARQFTPGDTFTLIQNAVGLDAASVVYDAVGLGMMNVFDISENGDLAARFRVFTTNPQTKALAESRMAGLSLLNHGSDMIFGSGLDGALAAGRAGGGGLMPFAAVEGASLRIKTGSHVDVDGFALMAGMSRDIRTAFGGVLFGGFFESGWGNYDSVNDFANLNSVYGHGRTSYHGGGLMARFDLPANFHGKIAARAGKVRSDYSGRNFLSGNASYDSDSAYFGSQVALGRVWHAGDKADVDFTASYFWNRQNGDRVRIGPDRLRLDPTDSHRARGSLRVSYSPTACFTAYAGAGFEYEFGDKAKGSLNGNRVAPPELKGGTGIGELGVRFAPAASNGFSVSASVQGYVGRRKGVSGGLRLGWSF
ncbi:MAG: hypothetical protein LBT97_05820 [Planctomycetota bacterium]|nr:hypothetical protein [Planctomycetota bacterium]